MHTNDMQIWPPMSATIVFLLRKQTVNAGAEQAGLSTATPKLCCLSSYLITLPISHHHCPKMSKKTKELQSVPRTQPK